MNNLVISKREKTCNKFAKKERKKGIIPGMLYGKNNNNFMFEVGEIELNKNLKLSGEHGVLNLQSGGKSQKALIKEVQREPVTNKILHVDLERVSGDDKIVTEVPLQFTGEGKINSKGGILQKEKTTVKVQCKANEIPNNLQVDLTKYDVGDICRLQDLEIGEDLTFIEPSDSIIALVTHNNSSSQEQSEEEIDG